MNPSSTVSHSPQYSNSSTSINNRVAPLSPDNSELDYTVIDIGCHAVSSRECLNVNNIPVEPCRTESTTSVNTPYPYSPASRHASIIGFPRTSSENKLLLPDNHPLNSQQSFILPMRLNECGKNMTTCCLGLFFYTGLILAPAGFLASLIWSLMEYKEPDKSWKDHGSNIAMISFASYFVLTYIIAYAMSKSGHP
jgi:hypothetical protein